MSLKGSVSQWIISLRGDDAEAAQRLWERYSAKLVNVARHKLGKAPRGIADEEDVAQSVFQSICRGAANGRFSNITNRDELWWLLIGITKRKVISHIRRENAQKRGGGRTVSETSLGPSFPEGEFTLDKLIGDEPTPDFVVMLQEQNTRLLSSLRDDRLRRVAIYRMEGYTVQEIAEILDISTRAVERKLQLIRKAWSKDLSCVD